MACTFNINDSLAASGPLKLDPTKLKDSVLEATFRNKLYAPLGYFPKESIAQLRARFFTPFKSVLKKPCVETFVDHASGETRTVQRGASVVWVRDFEAMNAASAAVLALEQREKRAKELEAKIAAKDKQLLQLQRALELYAAHEKVKVQVRKIRNREQPEHEKREHEKREHEKREHEKREHEKREQREQEQKRLKAELRARASAEFLERQRQAELSTQPVLVHEHKSVENVEDEQEKIKKAQRAEAKIAAKAAAKAEAETLKKLKKEQEEEDALLDAACAENAARQKDFFLQQKADKDLAALKCPLRILRLDSTVPQIPHAMAVFTMVFCIGMREKLMLNVLFRFSKWSLAAKIPGFTVLRPLFKEHLVINEREAVMPSALYNNSPIQTRGVQLVVQCMRNIMGVVLDLRCLIQPLAVDSIINTSSLYHSRFLMLANICKIRQLSLVILDAMDLLSTKKNFKPIPELLDLYEAVASFEQFVLGSDFTVFRQAFVLPKLPEISESMFSLPSARARVEDCVMAHGLKVEEFALWELHSDKPSFAKYKADCKPLFDITLALWKQQVMKPVAKWLKNVDLPTVEEFCSKPEFIELLPMWFGARTKKWICEPFKDLDPLVEAMKSNAKEMQADMSHQLINLAFLLSDGVHKFFSTFTQMTKLQFPFQVTLNEKWAAVCTHHTDKNDMILLNAHLLKLAERLGLE